ncbi:hypothetical protein SAMN05428969_1304 [Devosia sp. YR412]|uniref:hypothetical protein n=1 Tax=Devosia sp. YR412 TaxID=1881030 RepID=UPI0008D7B8E3|nr:hypothetical protein [Devosia sp. YR412]SEP96154.1 hypothetical protein SAMN05428969_1304 [Devosia sp. YR412]
MTLLLRTLLLATLLLILPSNAFADGRTDWKDYAWQEIKLTKCASDSMTVACPLYHQKWDWKRNQWVDITISMDLVRGELELTQRLTDNDPKDDDHVCVTALGVDAAGNNIIAHHQNWHMHPRQIEERAFSIRSSRLSSITSLFIGSKQCRQGASQDDDLYARVLAGIAN